MRLVYELENPKIWEEFYRHQAIQSGHGLPGFEGLAYQRGLGIGSFFRNLVRMIIPAARSAGKSVAKQALIVGADVAGDVIQGESFKESLKKRGSRAAGNLIDQARNKISEKKGYTRLQSGEGLGTLLSNNSYKIDKKSIKRKTNSRKLSAKRKKLSHDQLGYKIGIQYP